MPLPCAPGLSPMDWRGTPYLEYVGDDAPSPRVMLNPDGSRVDRTLFFPGDATSWKAAAANFVGYATVETGTGGVRYISRTTPHPFPLTDWMYCTGVPEIEMVSFQTTTLDVAEYRVGKAHVIYQALTYNVRDDAEMFSESLGGYPDEGYHLARGWDYSRYVTKTVKPSAKLLVLNRGAMWLVGADTSKGQRRPLMEGLPVVESCAEIQYVWHAVPSAGVPYAFQTLAIGGVNHDDFDGFPAQTLRLESVEPHPRRDVLGNRTWDIVYKMQFLPHVGQHVESVAQGPPSLSAVQAHGHNWVREADPIAGGKLVLMRVTSNGAADGDPPYRPVDFRLLFGPEQP